MVNGVYGGNGITQSKQRNGDEQRRIVLSVS